MAAKRARSDVDLLREMIGYVAQRLMSLEAESLCAAGHGERAPERTNLRNGYRGRLWETRAGAIELQTPKLRKGPYFPVDRFALDPGAAAYGREGAGGCDPGGLRARGLHPQRR